MNFQQHLSTIHLQYLEKMRNLKNELIGQAVGMLRADIQNPQLTNAEMPPDAFMLRANQIGIALLESGFFSIAEELYRILAEETLNYRTETNWRHAGALFANIGVACAAQRNFDKAVVELLKADREDERTYNTSTGESFAITGLLEQYFGRPIRNIVLEVAQRVNPSITLDDVIALTGTLGVNEYAFLSYAYVASTHEEAKSIFPNDFSHLQIFAALRNLSVLLEVRMKTISGNMALTFYPTIQNLYQTKHWWQDFENERVRVGATRNSAVPIDDQLRDSVNITPTDNNSYFWKSLLIAYIARNYTAHRSDISSALTQTYSLEVLGHILNVMITADNYT